MLSEHFSLGSHLGNDSNVSGLFGKRWGGSPEITGKEVGQVR